MGFRLKVTKGKSEGKEFSFTKTRVTVGRNHDNDLVLYDLNVSRHHFEILMVQGRYQLRDAGSQNGTKLNDAPVVEAKLFDGDRIQLGALEFVFSGSDTQPHISLNDSTERAELNAPASNEQRETLEQIQTYAVNIRDLAKMKKGGTLTPAPNKSPLHKTQKRQPTKRRSPWLYVAIAGGVALVVVVVFALLYEKKAPDLSDRVFTLSSRPDPQSCGAGNVDVNTPRRCQFGWKSSAGRAFLTFVAGGIDRDGEVFIEVNGQRLSNVVVTGAAWGRESEVKLPRHLLKPNVDNVVAFVSQATAGEQLRWGVRDVALSEDALPQPSLERAKEKMKIADDAITHRKIALGNLGVAEEAYKQAVLYMEALDPQPPEYKKAEEAMKKATKELGDIMQSSLFNADRALKAGRRDEAEAALKELLLYFPIPADPRHQIVAARLESLGAK